MKVETGNTNGAGNDERRQCVNDDAGFEFGLGERELHPQGSYLAKFMSFSKVTIEFNGEKGDRLELRFVTEDTNEADENREVTCLASPYSITPSTQTWQMLVAMGVSVEDLKAKLKSKQFRLSEYLNRDVALNITHVPKKKDPTSMREELGFFPAATLKEQRRKQAAKARPNFGDDEDTAAAA